RPRRWRAASCSSPPTNRPGSPARRSPSTAASSWIEDWASLNLTSDFRRPISGFSPSRLEAFGRDLEAVELEARRHRRPGERPGAQAARRLPGARRHERLRVLAGEQVRSEPVLGAGVLALDRKQKRRAAVPVPQLCGIEPVPARHLFSLEQEEDRRRVRPPAVAARVAVGLAVPAAFRMRLEAEMGDDLVGGQDLYRHALPSW